MKEFNYKDDLSCWFGLSYASWLTIPRVFMEAMPEEWQQKMANLLFEYDEALKNPPNLGTRVQITHNGKLVKTPNWIINYRHPDKEKLQEIFNERPNPKQSREGVDECYL